MAPRRKRRLSTEAVSEGGSLRARLRKRTAYANRDPERKRAKQILSRAAQRMGIHEKKLCVFLDDEFFILGIDDLNLTLFRVTEGKPKLQGYFPRLSHLLRAYLERRVNTAAATKTDELIAVLTRVEAAIQTLDDKELFPVPVPAVD